MMFKKILGRGRPTLPTKQKDEFENQILEKARKERTESENELRKLINANIAQCNMIESMINNMKQLIGQGVIKESTLSDKILRYLGDNLDKKVPLGDIVKNTVDGKGKEADNLKLVTDELYKLLNSGESGIGYFGQETWMLPAKSEPAPETQK